MRNRRSPNGPLRLTSPITRRDFVNGVLAGCGAALVAGCNRAPVEAVSSLAPSGSPWTGYGGVGDYAWSNGNTAAVIEAAHRIRDGSYPAAESTPVDEEFDLVIVGGGFSGITAAYEFVKRAGAGRRCLLLENHPVMGGEAKQNEFIVDGRRLAAPQGSNAGLVIGAKFTRGSYDSGRHDIYADYYRELGLPTHFDLEPLAGGAERYEIPNYHYAPMHPASESSFATGYFFRGHAGCEIR